MHLEAALIEHASPTLVGLKPASLFRVSPASGADFARQFLYCRTQLAALGLELLVLKGCRKRNFYLLYLYRPGELAALLEQPDHRAFLLEMGYAPWRGVRDCLRQLAARICLEQDFPHEIGVFLGYPLEDVTGFIRHKGRNYTFCGCWKCYGDPGQARLRFERYRRCTELFRRRYAQGVPIARLVVAA